MTDARELWSERISCEGQLTRPPLACFLAQERLRSQYASARYRNLGLAGGLTTLIYIYMYVYMYIYILIYICIYMYIYIGLTLNP